MVWQVIQMLIKVCKTLVYFIILEYNKFLLSGQTNEWKYLHLVYMWAKESLQNQVFPPFYALQILLGDYFCKMAMFYENKWKIRLCKIWAWYMSKWSILHFPATVSVFPIHQNILVCLHNPYLPFLSCWFYEWQSQWCS